MQKSFKRTLSLLLAVLMVMTLFTALPLTVSAAENEPEIAGTSITLNGAIGLNFYVKENGNNSYNANFDYDSSFLSGDSDPTTNLSDDAVYDNTNTYRIYTINLFAKQMTEEVISCVSDTETKTTSVREYAEKIISGESDQTLTEQGYSADKIEKAKELCKAMLNYGALAQTEFNYKTDDLANKNHSEYTAPALDPASITDMDYSNPAGAWMTESSRAYQFVNTYDWEHVYVHYLFDKEKQTVWHEEYQYWETETVFCDDIVEEIFPSDYTYTSAYDGSDISNGKRIFIFEPSEDFKYLIFTNSPESIVDENIYSNCQYASVQITSYDSSAGWKNWKNGEESSSDTIYDNPVNFIDFVNVPKWSSVSVDVITSEWSEQNDQYVDVSHVYPMTKLSEKAADGSDIYRFVLPAAFTENSSDVTIKFTNGSDATLQTTYSTRNNIHRYTPSQRTDKFEKFGMTYSGSSIGLLQKIGYSLFFSDIAGFYSEDYNSIELYCGEKQLNGDIDPQYEYLGYSCYSITDIAPSDLLKPITITFKWYDSDWIEQSEDYQFTVCNYIKRALMLDDSNNNNIQLKKTVTALVDYAEKADAYFKAN